MIAAILTAFCFALSAVTGQKVAVRLGAMWGNFLRLAIAALALGAVVALVWPESLRAETLIWFLLSGLIGFGIGDVALFLAYERLGSRLTILLNLCLAPVFAMALEWLWLGNALGWRVMLCVAIILAGVTMALRPGTRHRQRMERRGRFGVGVLAAATAGMGQGFGAVVSRKADAIAIASGLEINGISAAFQRVLAGLAFALLTVLALHAARAWRRRERPIAGGDPAPALALPQGRAWLWLLGAALFGPVIGVSCFQWALTSLESGIVLAVVATTPIVMLPLAALTEGDHPTRLAISGAAVGVVGVVLLNLWARSGG
jgi:drug/metabolite transporter (DMT)-like permease